MILESELIMMQDTSVYYEPSTLPKGIPQKSEKASELAEKAGVQLGLETMEKASL